MPEERTGFLVAITNPNFSGLATAHFVRTREDLVAKNFTLDTVDRVSVEAGFGVRQIMAAHGGKVHVHDDMPVSTYVLDDFGILAAYGVG